MTLRCCFHQKSNGVTAAQSQASCKLRGLAIATCCHHLCQWRSYISNLRNLHLNFMRNTDNCLCTLHTHCFILQCADILKLIQFGVLINKAVHTAHALFHLADKKYISDMGFTKEDFHAISWFTSWAVDADHSSGFSVTDCSAQLEIM